MRSTAKPCSAVENLEIISTVVDVICVSLCEKVENLEIISTVVDKPCGIRFHLSLRILK